MRALARSHRQPAPENKTCRLFEAARGRHFMRAATGVNRSANDQAVNIRCRGRSHLQGLTERNMWTPLMRTLAPESRHIVASKTSGTTSRAVVLSHLVAGVRRKRSGALFAFGEG